MRLYEWEAKQRLLADGAPIPSGGVAVSTEDAAAGAQETGFPVMLKAQALSGGRGKAGLIRRVETVREATAEAGSLLGVQHEDEVVRAILVEAHAEVEDELFLAITVDDVQGCPVLLLSRHGGVDVEEDFRAGGEVASVPVDVLRGLRPHDALPAATALALRGRTVASLSTFAATCWRTFARSDASMLEVNPLGILRDGSCLALDAKMTIDDDALYRHRDLAERPQGATGLTEREARARALRIRYTELGGTVAVLSGGAGMTMAIVDAIRHHGGSPANFVDVMGGINADSARSLAAIVLEHVEADPSVMALLVNVSLTASPIAPFVEGFEEAFRDSPPRVPALGCVRGTGAAVLSMPLAEARARLEALGVRLLPTLDEAIREAVAVTAAALER